MPDSLATRAALGRLDFVVVVDQFLTDTAACADVFLPSTTMLEEEDLLPSYGHLWMQLMQPVVAPEGECRSDLAIFQALAERLGFGADMGGSPAEWIDRVAAPFAGVSYQALRAARGRLMPDDTPRVPWATGRFKTPSGRFVFPDRLDDDPVLPPDGYLHLVFLATEQAINSQINEEQQRSLASVRVHPRTAEAHGMSDGERIGLVSSSGGQLAVTLALDEGVREDTVVALKGEWLKHGRGFNVLTEQRYTEGTGAAFNQNYVRLVRSASR